MKEINNQIYILLGSNINPEENIRSAITALSSSCDVQKISSVWESEAIGSDGPNFLNVAVLVRSPQKLEDFKWNILRTIENNLGRVRKADKNAPRTIDLDILIFNNQIVDSEIWEYAHIALPLSDIHPDLTHPTKNIPLAHWADGMFDPQVCFRRSDLVINN